VDRRSLIVVGTLATVLAAAIVVGVVLSSGGGGNQSVRTPSGSVTTTTVATVPPTTTTAPIVAPKTVPTLPPPTFVIHPGTTTSTPATTAPTPPTTVPGGSDIGISAHEIRIAVIADDPGGAHGVQAWATTINQTGGLAGRTLRVDVRLVNSQAGYSAAVAASCPVDFAVVGSSSQYDSASSGLACGVPELATRILDATHRGLPNAYAVIPTGTGVTPVGGFKRILATVSGCCRQYVLVPTTDPARTATRQSVQGATAIGFTTAGTPDVAPGADYAALVRDLVAKHATFASSGLGAASTVHLRKAAAANPSAAAVKAWYCDTGCGDNSFLTNGGPAVEGQLVDLGVNPLLDQHQIATMAAYVRSVRHLGPPTVAGLESYSAGLLFEQVARQVATTNGKNGLTRVRVLGALAGVHDFTAGGILGVTDVAARQPTGCHVLLQVQGGKFVRSFPTDPGQLDCGAQNLQPVPGG